MVIIHSPGAVLMPWADTVSSIIAAFVPGQADGAAITVRVKLATAVAGYKGFGVTPGEGGRLGRCPELGEM